jgi:hypothetical protein
MAHGACISANGTGENVPQQSYRSGLAKEFSSFKPYLETLCREKPHRRQLTRTDMPSPDLTSFVSEPVAKHTTPFDNMSISGFTCKCMP